MSPELVQTFILVEAVVIILVGLFYTFYLHSKEKKLKTDSKDIDKKIYTVTEEAQFQAKMIIGHAVKKAQEILSETEYLKKDLTQDARKKVTQLAESYLSSFKTGAGEVNDAYKKALLEIQEKFLEDEKIISQEMEQIQKQELASFKDILKGDAVTAGSYLQKKVDAEFEKAQAEIENYKQEKLAQINKSVDELALKLARQVLGKSIPLEDHQTLIIEALERAKKEGIFS